MVAEIIAALRRSAVVRDIDVIEALEEEHVQFVRVRAEMIDGSILHVRELLGVDHSKYSYQWQSAAGETLLRWDNAPHHREISTHPDHQHERDRILPSIRVSIEDVLPEIARRLKRQQRKGVR